MKLSGSRATRRDNFLLLARRREMTWNQYRSRVATLERQERKYLEKKAEREAEKERKAEEKEKKRQEQIAENRRLGQIKRKETIVMKKKQEEAKKKIGSFLSQKIKERAAFRRKKTIVFTERVEVRNANNVWGLFKQFPKTLISVSATLENEDAKSFDFSARYEIDKPSNAFQSLILDARATVGAGSDKPAYFSKGSIFTIQAEYEVKAKKSKQSFKEGAVNCFLFPVIEYLKSVSEGYKTKESKKKIEQIIRRAEAMELEYRDDGIPEDKVEEVCKSINISVTLYDILTNKINEYNPGKNWKISFYNTRFNHVDMGKLCLKDQPVEISEEEMHKMIIDYVKHDVFFMTQGKSVFTKEYIMKIKNTNKIFIKLKDFPIPSLVRTLHGSFKLMNKDAEDMEAMNNKINLYNNAVDAVKYPSLAKFLKAGYIVNSKPVVFQDQELAVSHLDMKNAYSQHHQAGKYYAGFPSKIYKWSKLNCGIDFVKNHLGYYKVIVESSNSFFSRLGLVVGKEYVLFSQEILCLHDLGMNFKILAGAWGNSIDIEFNEEMLDSRGLFREWCGKLGMDNKDTCFTFYDTEELAQNIKADHENVKVYYRNGQINLYVPKTRQPTFFHLAGAFTSYTRINILMKMKEIGFDNVVKVVLDGIFSSVEGKQDKIFRNKSIRSHLDTDNTWYMEFSEGVEEMCNDWPEFDGISERLTLLQGAGGCGKTHSILKTSYHDVLYVAPTRMLSIKMAQETKCFSTTLHKLIGLDADDKKVRSWSEENNHTPAVILIDERTMLVKSMVEKAVKMYPDSMILLAGDMEGKMWFQTRFGDGNTWADLYEADGWAVKEYTTDYRAKDNKLKNFKLAIRDEMRRVFTDGGQEDTHKIEEWVAKNVDITPFVEAIDQFKNGSSLWIASTNEMSKKLLDAGIVSGYRVKHATRQYSKGEIHDEDVGACCEKRGSITTHSSQGLTIKKEKIFISIYGSFEYSMLYTAISRAERWEQLVFVGH